MSPGDLDLVEQILSHRNEIAHELPNLVVGHGFDVDVGHFPLIAALVERVDLFWFRHEWFDSSGVADERVVSPRLVILKHLMKAVSDYQLQGQRRTKKSLH